MVVRKGKVEIGNSGQIPTKGMLLGADRPSELKNRVPQPNERAWYSQGLTPGVTGTYPSAGTPKGAFNHGT